MATDRFGSPIIEQNLDRFGNPIIEQDLDRFGSPVVSAEPAEEKPEELVSVKPAGVMEYDPTSEFAGVEEGVMPAKELAYYQQQIEKKINFEDLYKQPEYFDIVKDYVKARHGREYTEGDSREEFVKNYMADLRFSELNTVLGAIPELNLLKNAPQDVVNKLARGRRLYEMTAGAGEAGGQPGFRPYADAIFAVASDPLSYVGFGAGKFAAAGVGRAAVSQAAKKALVTTAGAGVEATGGVAASVVDQKVQQETAKAFGEKPEDLDGKQMAVAAIVSGLFGAAEARAVAGEFAPRAQTRLEERLSTLKIKAGADIGPPKPNSPPTPVEQALVDPLRDNMDAQVDKYIAQEGRLILDTIDPATPLTDPGIATELSKRAVRVAMRVIELDESFRPKQNQQISSAIARVFANIETIDDVVLESAIRNAGLTPDQFAAANKVTVSDAARIMQQYSVAERLLTRLRGIDPDFDKRIKELYGQDNDQVSAFGHAVEGIRAVERESKVWITSGVDTTVRNVLGTGVGMTAKTAVQFMEGYTYALGVGMRNLAKGKEGFKTTSRAFSDATKDAIGMFYYMKNNGLATDVTDAVLVDNPALRNRMLSALQETDRRNVSVLGRWASVLNTAQDAYIRRAVFTASVEQQLRRVGVDLYADILEKNKAIPAPILSKAVDDSLKMTFSYMPKARKGMSLEAMAETGANFVVRGLEKLPFGSLAVPFPRFMANAMAFQYRYSPLGFASAGADIIKGTKMMNSGQYEKGLKLVREGREKAAQGMIGTAALTAAFHYRMENQDTEWYNVKRDDGSTIDIRALFPLAPYFAIADVLARNRQGLTAKTDEAIQAVVGIKLPAGSQNVILDRMISALSSDKDADKFAVSAGKIIGDFFGRFTQPFVVKQVYDLFDMFRPDGTIARDPNVIEEGTATEMGMAAATQRIKGRIPVLKEDLPEAQPRLREGPVVREGEFFSRLFGFRVVPKRTPEEIEVARLNLNPYRIYGSGSGDKEYDNAFIAEANKLVIPRVKSVIESPSYKKLTDAEKTIQIKSAVRQMTSIAREITAGKFMGKDLNKVYRMRFNKLPEEERRVINAYHAQENNGVTLEESGDFTQLDKYEAMLGALKFAAGGSVAGKLLGKAGKAAINKAPGEKVTKQDFLKALEIPKKPEAEQTAKMLETPAAPAPVAAPTPASTYNFPNKAFDDADYQAAEAEMIESLGADKVNELKATQPKQFSNLLHSNTFDSKFSGLSFMDKLKLKKEFPSPYKTSEVEKVESPFKVEKSTDDVLAKTEDEVIDEVENVDYYAQRHEQKKKVYVGKPEARRGVVDIRNDFDWRDERDALIDQVKAVRINSFPDIVKMFPDNDEIVLAKAQGEYRFKYQAEADPANAQSMKKFKALVNKEQKDYNNLAEKYKNILPVILNHGSKEGERAIDNLVEKGFSVPSQVEGKWHSELNVGAISFQTDFSLPFFGNAVGGRDAGNFLRTLMPREDYEFLRINIPQNVYQSSRDINQVMRSLTGSETVARPLGIPRTKGFHEQEDAFPEADKLVLIKSRRKAGEKFSVAEKIEEERTGLVKYFKDNNYKTEFTPKEQEEYYRNVKKYLNNFLDQAKLASPGKGFGSNYEKYLGKTTAELGQRGERFTGGNITEGMKKSDKGNIETAETWGGEKYDVWIADSSNKFFNTLDRVAELMKQRGSTQKSKNLRNLRRYLALTSDQSKGVKVNKNAAQKVRQLTPKLRQGGLASRR